MQRFKLKDFEIYYQSFGNPESPALVWAHGWGQSHESFMQLAAPFQQGYHHIMVDFPGFGASPPPPAIWSTADYADAIASLIKEQIKGKVVWIGHSFGCRVGLQIAARHPELTKGLFLIAAAGLKRKRPLHQALGLKGRVLLYKTLKKLVPLGAVREEWLKSKFGAADYKNVSGIMRSVFVKTVNENLATITKAIACPVTLVYGTQDTETPLEIGQRLNKLISGSRLVELDGLDHYSVLSSGRHQVAHILQGFMQRLNNA